MYFLTSHENYSSIQSSINEIQRNNVFEHIPSLEKKEMIS